MSISTLGPGTMLLSDAGLIGIANDSNLCFRNGIVI